MKAHVVDLATYRRCRRIVQRIPIMPSDAMIAKAREVEQQLRMIEEGEALLDFSRAMAGNSPCDVEQR